MPFNASYFDTMWDIKTEREAFNALKFLVERRAEDAVTYEKIHRALREQGVTVPKKFKYQINMMDR